ncbi:MAG: transposase [Armatimonadetes bacterium]|nr:transposase [Armatimonadota bacterium]
MAEWFHRYKNFGQSGDVVFITTTILDFVPVFSRPHLADLMTGGLLDDHRHYAATLYAFVVMPHHIHFLVRLPERRDASWFLNRVKSNAAKRLLPHTDAELRRSLAVQQGLNQRMFWRPSFRSFPVKTLEQFVQKVEYIHANPVRAGLCEGPAAYRWSSAWMYEAGIGSWENGLPTDDAIVSRYCDRAELKLPSRDTTRGDHEAADENPQPERRVGG